MVYLAAMAATVKHITTFEDSHSVVLVTINSVLQRGKVHLQEDKTIELWVNATCVCPQLRVGRGYLIIGNEDVLLNKLRFGETTLVTRWNSKWQKKFKVTEIISVKLIWTSMDINKCEVGRT